MLNGRKPNVSHHSWGGGGKKKKRLLRLKRDFTSICRHKRNALIRRDWKGWGNRLSEDRIGKLFHVLGVFSFLLGFVPYFTLSVSRGFLSPLCIVLQKKHRKHRKTYPKTAGFPSQLQKY